MVAPWFSQVIHLPLALQISRAPVLLALIIITYERQRKILSNDDMPIFRKNLYGPTTASCNGLPFAKVMTGKLMADSAFHFVSPLEKILHDTSACCHMRIVPFSSVYPERDASR